MRRVDDVFFFTLIDFLVQVFFFGLLVFVVGRASQAEREEKHGQETKQIEDLKKAAGISNLTELTDSLTKLAPVSELKGVADFVRREGGLEKVKEATKVVADAGGISKIRENLDRLRKYEEGSGKPPCLFEWVNNKKVSRPLAVVVAGDASIRFESSSAELEGVLKRLGRTYDSVRELPLGEFKKTFGPMVQIQPDCRYTLHFIETTRLVDARDAARFAFYLNINKR